MATLRDALNQFSHAASIDIQNAVRRAVKEGVNNAIVAGFEEFGKSVNNVKGNKNLFLQANEALARSMQTAVLHSYDQVVTARKQFDSYRKDDPQNPRLTGHLRAALAAPQFMTATAQGIAFANEDWLNSEAKHWQRLQYGAGDAATEGRAPVLAELQLQGEPLGFIELAQAPRPGFKMPFGIWSNGEDGLEAGFHPRAHPLTVPTKGIQARRFLDAGLTALERDFPIVYGDLIVQFEVQAANGGKNPPTTNVIAKA